MAEDWPTYFTRQANARVDAFLAAHSGYVRQDVPQPVQGATNRVVFARRDARLVVFKVFCEPERKERECFGLRHWRHTGLVPELLQEVDDTLILTSHTPGMGIDRVRKEGEPVWLRACRAVGKAMGTLARVPLSPREQAAFESRFYRDVPTLETYLCRITELGRGIQARDPDFRGAFWQENLDFIEAHLPVILSQPRVLYHQDVGNLHLLSDRFSGFFDLEMCRVGCAAMQLGSALGLAEGRKEAWEALRTGWEEEIGARLTPEEIHAVAAASALLAWREISRYLSYDGTPGTGFDWADPADPGFYRSWLRATNTMLGVH